MKQYVNVRALNVSTYVCACTYVCMYVCTVCAYMCAHIHTHNVHTVCVCVCTMYILYVHVVYVQMYIRMCDLLFMIEIVHLCFQTYQRQISAKRSLWSGH